MPMKLNVGVCRKVGQPDYGSIGATCNVEVELSSSLLQDDLEGFQRQVRTAYDACRQAVSDELAKSQSAGTDTNRPRTSTPPSSESNAGHQNGNGQNANSARAATEKQLTYIRQLSGQIKGLGVRKLETLAGNMYGKPMAGLSSFEASGVIDCLKGIKAGEIDLQAALNGATT